MSEVYKMVPVKSETKVMLERELRKMIVASGATKRTYDDLIKEKFSVQK